MRPSQPPSTGGAASPAEATTPPTATAHDIDPADYPSSAAEWGEHVAGVRTRLDTDDTVVALTFDACGGDSGSGYDADLIDFLLTEEIPATLFFNLRWIEANERAFTRLAAEPLFEIANHGTEHRPLSVTGQSAYGVTGTAGPADVVDEIMVNQEAIHQLSGHWPAWLRSGTAYYDEVAVRIAQDLGFEVVNYDVLGDAGATFSAEQVSAALTAAQPGSVALLHMNHPGSGTAEGVARAVPELRARGFEFARLGDHGVA
ncbi:polysaccharide deacetylase family protein [Phytoactinopolyspora mesophila]|uniref:Polysaccharide deacetylase family protein n=1 Tax=Phytoactinopolyspora mesophila TaxID=2650750 RepID=A0A7K3M4I8_9ACTN|nr:polysaccharide deacetylase family protein [Phytoactinopolyspora mesophila]NDL57338.1 polysaccharide deacetylase family protein [Phytoactinopolyspora mesophila]